MRKLKNREVKDTLKVTQLVNDILSFLIVFSGQYVVSIFKQIFEISIISLELIIFRAPSVQIVYKSGK